ncbi:sister chromatid cohesion C-terminus-domain-containing protein [Massariosphaeria phaeospora]|uniref:Sister chromatid cohesion protein n=1 Tax=Massariosphaeria phaeospora TaxID=100035 RepID=A0A7C8MEY9_9PLEO|nr:sister chromatid cohesion C-terminus-domain-containing protein [Massariosphaeria phaeospora]
MSSSYTGNWHNANGGGLPFRPPTVDEALPFSPFTSVVPFSPEIIPFPTTEPPTPSTTLDLDQQNLARKAVGILDEEIRSAAPTAQYLQNTLSELRKLLDPAELPEYHFKPATYLATPKPDSPSTKTNGSTAPKNTSMSLFASMLLEKTDVDFLQAGQQSSQRPRVKKEHQRQHLNEPPTRTNFKPQIESLNNAPRANLPNVATSTPFASTNTSNATPARPGPAIVIKPLPPTARREEYQRYDKIGLGNNLSQRKREDRVENEMPTMRPQEREIANRKTHELRSFVDELSDEKDQGEESRYFRKLVTDETELTVLRHNALASLCDKASSVVNTGVFSSLSVEDVLQLQSLCEGSVTAASQISLDPTEGETDAWIDRLAKAESGLRASRLVLDSMINGRDDRQICPEDLVTRVMQATKHMLTTCIIPVVESRRTGTSSDLFDVAVKHQKELHSVLRLCGNIFSRVAALIGKVNLTDTALNPVAFLSLELIVVQNGDNEKDSALGIQKFELFRQKAVEVIAQIFACHPDQRNFVIAEVLNSLEKLPDKRASARQFKSAREAPIMLLSALFMRVVQVAATNREKQDRNSPADAQSGEAEIEDSNSDSDDERPRSKKTPHKLTSNRSPIEIARQLMHSATGIAGHIAHTLIDRASNVSKSGDKPFRNLLDLFIEDFCNVLGSPEWPAAVLLLQQLLLRMNTISSDKDAKAIAKDMALSAIAKMGCGIIDFKIRLKQQKRTLDVSQSDLTAKLDNLAGAALDNQINDKGLLAFDGPYRMVLESLPSYLNPQAGLDDPHLQSISGCHVTFWMHAFDQAFVDKNVEAPRPQIVVELQQRLETMLMDPKWLSREYKFEEVAESQSQIAAGIITLQDAFCKYLPNMINVLLLNTRNHLPKLKARGMSGLTQLIEKDARILNEAAFVGVTKLVLDASASVRETTVSLISKCLEQNRSLERHCLQAILHLMVDPNNAPKKRAIKLLKEIFQGPTSKENKLMIAVQLLLPSQDDDKAIAELTNQVLEEIWLTPITNNARADESQVKLDRNNRVSLLVDTVHKIQDQAVHLEAFEKFFAGTLSSKTKNSSANSKMCKELVTDMVEGVISTDSTQGSNSQARILQALSIFAKINPALFTLDQVQILKVYVKDLSGPEDLASFRPTVTIFRFVFPSLPSLQPAFAEEVRGSLSNTISKLANWASQGKSSCKDILVDVAHCLWMISPLVEADSISNRGGIEKLIILITSVVTQLEPLSSCTKEMAIKKKISIMSYLTILGTFGKVCDLDRHVNLLQRHIPPKAQALVNNKQATEAQMKRLTNWEGSSVSVLLLESVRPFTMQSWDMSFREPALGSVGGICQQSPNLFMRADVEKVFKLVFINQDNTQLKRVALTQFRDFFASAERRSETGAEIAVGDGAVHGAARLGTSFKASENDSATLHLAQKFLSDIVSIALGNSNDLAFLATDLIVSISRQGLVHPKECGPALIALETSPFPQIAQAAYTQHQKIHSQHETMFEKEYMTAVRQTFVYQRDVCEDSHGLLQSTYKPKMLMLFEVLKSGSRKTLKKFLDNICKQMDFGLSKLDSTGVMPDAVLFARFCLENIGVFDYARGDEVAQVILAFESTVLKSTGPSVALAIETEMSRQLLEPRQQPQEVPVEGVPSEGVPQEPKEEKETISDDRLRHLTVACMILQMMWETRSFVRKLYNMPGKINAKDFQKPATRMNFLSAKELWERITPIMSALDSREAMLKQCFDFAELLEVDKDAKVDDEDINASEQLARAAAGYETPEEDGEGANQAVPNSARGRKRKSIAQGGTTPKKARGRLAGNKTKKRTSKTPEGEDWD